ncbi:unnamed protein product, partial [Prorocentrum cordatum]
ATIFRMMHGPGVLARARTNLSSTWARQLLWKRCQKGAPEKFDELAKVLLCLSVEALVQKSWRWYGPLMFRRRLEQVRLSGDRTDILAIDGNAKLYRRTCGMPFSHVVYCAELDKYLLRGCPDRPHGKGAMCCKRAKALVADPPAPHETVCNHRLRRALHGPDDWLPLEVQLKGFARRWQPACAVSPDALASYFGTGADARIQARRARRMALRKQGAAGKKGRKEKSFMTSRGSNGPRAASECSTRKETDAHIVAAAPAAGFLTAVSASGILAHVEELMRAEPLSQRYRFLAIVAAHMPDLKIVVHDDACHLRLMAEKNGEGAAVAARLATEAAYIVDDYHSSGPTALLSKFPTNISEIMNCELSPLGHVIHHVGRWASQFYVQEMVGALNMKTLGRMRGAQATAARKVARASEAASASAEKKPRQL